MLGVRVGRGVNEVDAVVEDAVEVDVRVKVDVLTDVEVNVDVDVDVALVKVVVEPPSPHLPNWG